MQVTVLGATGLIGSHLMEELIADQTFNEIRVVSRRPLPDLANDVDVRVIDFADADAYAKAMAGTEVLFCAVGTTNKKVKGNKSDYRKVDFDIPVNGARHLAATGGKAMFLISSVGADSSSGNFYIRLKGEVEDAIRSFPLESLTILRPSMLLGSREETRIGESIGKFFMKLFAFATPSQYKPIHAATIARALVNGARKKTTGAVIWHYDEIIENAGPEV